MNKVRIIAIFVMLVMFFTFTNVSPVAAQTCSSNGLPTVGTDKEDYGPFETVTISGSSFGCGDVLSVLVTAPDGSTLSGDGTGSAGPDTVTTDENGAFLLSYHLSGTLPSGGTYAGQLGAYTVEVMDSSGALLASTTFTDGQGDHTCALMLSGGVECWGYNVYGQLGDGTFDTSSDYGKSTPVAVSGLSGPVAQVSTGSLHTCALMLSGGVECWGHNFFGQLGDGTFDTFPDPGKSTPVAVSELSGPVAQVSAGGLHTCALMMSGGVECWGLNVYGQLGDDTSYPYRESKPVAVSELSGPVAQVSAGEYHTCALMTSGGVECWGFNVYGQLGDGTFDLSFPYGNSNPVAVSELSGPVAQQVSAGRYHTCALMTSGGVECWGRNNNGQLGDGTFTTSFPYGKSKPVAVSGLSGVDRVSAGGFHTCALMTSGSVECWGYNYFGQLGDGTFDTSSDYGKSTPVAVSELSGVDQVSAGVRHTCALMTSGGVECWGRNYYGQLGDGTFDTSSPYGKSTPVAVIGLFSVVALPDAFNLNEPPTADAGGSYSGTEGTAITISGASASDPDMDTLTYNWTVSDSVLCSFDVATVLNPNLTCSDNGSFTATLVVNDGTESVSSDAVVTVINVVPAVSLSGDSNVDEGSSYTLNLSAVTDPGADTLAGCTIDWGDSNSESCTPGSSAMHTYADGDNNYTISVDLTDEDGTFLNVASLEVMVDNVEPSLSLSGDSNVDEGSSYTLNLSAVTDPGADTLAGCTVDWGDSNSESCTPGSSATHTYDDGDNNYTISVDLTDEDGTFLNVASLGVMVDNVEPSLSLSGDSNVDERSSYTLNLSAVTDPGADTLAGCTVDWGDSNSESCTPGSSAMHTYDDGDNNYTISVDLTDEDGTFLNVAGLGVMVDNVAPSATFANDGPVDEGTSFNLSLTSPFDPSSADTTADFTYAFDCGDGGGLGAFSTTTTAVCTTDDDVVRAVKGQIKDKDGDFTEYTASVTVINVVPAVGLVSVPTEPIDINNQPVTGVVSAPFTDPGTADTHICTVDYNDGTGPTSGTVVAGTCTGPDQTYTEAGVYEVTVEVTDDDGGVGSATATSFIVIYDPAGGFVTGGGWIDSPAGACPVFCDDATGKANFGFVSKYKKGASTPTGQTEFQFKAGGLNFHSSSYEWLVIAGGQRQVQGRGHH